MIDCGCNIRTNVHRIDCFWETLGDAMDFKKFSDIGIWIGKNEKVLNKKPSTTVVKLIAEQFPTLRAIETRDDHGRLARWTK